MNSLNRTYELRQLQQIINHMTSRGWVTTFEVRELSMACSDADYAHNRVRSNIHPSVLAHGDSLITQGYRLLDTLEELREQYYEHEQEEGKVGVFFRSSIGRVI